jgi:5-methylcytosine-specific restriction endonuclease McrA
MQGKRGEVDDDDKDKSNDRKSKRKYITARKSTIIHEVCRQLAESGAHRHGVKFDSEDDAYLRQKLLNLDGRCEYCERRRAVTVDHFMPLVRDRKPTRFCNDAWNSIPCCRECNSSKGGKTYDEWFESKSAFNPLVAFEDDEPGKQEKRRMWRKFASYDIIFRVRCKRTRDLQEAWWAALCEKIDSFVQDVQQDVDAYASGGCR